MLAYQLQVHPELCDTLPYQPITPELPDSATLLVGGAVTLSLLWWLVSKQVALRPQKRDGSFGTGKGLEWWGQGDGGGGEREKQ